jgi:RNA polymerase sigma factor (sigma-70 family)
MMEAVTDRSMVEAVVARVPGAGRAFIACHDAFVRKTVLHVSPGAASLVDDLTHDVYIHLWGNDFRALRQWNREHPLRAYLGTIARRLVWDRLGRLQPVWELVDEDPFSVAGPEPCDLAPTPEDEVAANETLCIVRDALGRLDSKQCHVLELRFVRDLSYREIGDALGITSNNAGVRINRALARLKAALPHLVDSADCLAFSAPEARV